LPIWDSWDLTAPGMGSWDNDVTSLDINIRTNRGLVFETGGVDDRQRLNAFLDVSTLPSEVNNLIASFTVSNRQPLRCVGKRKNCYLTNSRCSGTNFRFARTADRCWTRYRGRSYCTVMSNCVEPWTQLPVAP